MSVRGMLLLICPFLLAVLLRIVVRLVLCSLGFWRWSRFGIIILGSRGSFIIAILPVILSFSYRLGSLTGS